MGVLDKLIFDGTRQDVEKVRILSSGGWDNLYSLWAVAHHFMVDDPYRYDSHKNGYLPLDETVTAGKRFNVIKGVRLLELRLVCKDPATVTGLASKPPADNYTVVPNTGHLETGPPAPAYL